MPNSTLCIGPHKLGPGHPTFIVAEMSGNHGGSLERALELVQAAKNAGADAVKLQTYTADTITLDADNEDFRLPSDSPWSDHSTLHALYRKAHTPWDWHAPIFAEAKRLGLTIFSSPFDESAVDLLESLDAPAYKIASPEITHIPLIRKAARTGKPVILSSGVATAEDLQTAVDAIRAEGNQQIIVLKCTTSYPAPLADSNLRTIPDIMQRFQVLSGLSDHTTGLASPLATVVLGGSMVEKHFCLKSAPETVDSFFSFNEDQLKQMVDEIRATEKILGRVSYELTPSAAANLRGRRSLYVASDIAAGESLSPLNIRSVRPSFGLHPKHYDEVLGKTAKRPLRKGERLSWDMLES